MDDSIRKFIAKFQPGEPTPGYWFAYVLFNRFIRDGAEIVYAQEADRFGTKINGNVYDITGNVTNLYDWVSWFEINDRNVRRAATDKHIMF